MESETCSFGIALKPVQRKSSDADVALEKYEDAIAAWNASKRSSHCPGIFLTLQEQQESMQSDSHRCEQKAMESF